MAGLTDSGFSAPNLAEVKTSIEDALRTRIGSFLNFLPTSVNAQFVGVISEQIQSVWQTALNLYSGLDPDSSSGVLLEYFAALTGVTRLVATRSTVTLTLSLDATTTVPSGSLVSHGTTSAQFRTTAAVTSVGSGDYPVAAESVLTGPIEASAATLTAIDSPTSGWTAVTNATDALPGTDLESDAALRIRRTQSLAVQGGSTLDAVVADVGAVTNVALVRGYENVTASVDADGRQPHSIEVVIIDSSADDDALAQALWDSKAASVRTVGTSSGEAEDDLGDPHTQYFTRASTLNLYVDVTLEKNEDYPSDGDDQVKAAIIAAVATGTIGRDQYSSVLYASVFTVVGVVNVSSITIGTGAAPVTTEVVLAYNETPAYSDSGTRLTVASTNA